MAERVEILFQRLTETKNTVKFQELTAEGQAGIIGILYVQKAALADMGQPTQLKVTIENG